MSDKTRNLPIRHEGSLDFKADEKGNLIVVLPTAHEVTIPRSVGVGIGLFYGMRED